MRILLALLFLVGAETAAVDQLEIQWKEKNQTLSVDRFEKEFPQKERTSLDPHFNNQEHKNGGTYLDDLMKKLGVPPSLTRIQIDAYDGYEVEFDLASLKRYSPMITVRLDGETYNGKNWKTYRGQGLGAYYLTLDSKQFPEIQNPDFFKYWIFTMKRIRFLGPEEGLPALTSEIGKWPEGARRGGTLFVSHCITCHQVGGQGGTKGPSVSDSIYQFDKDRADFIEFVKLSDPDLPMPPFGGLLSPDEIGSIFEMYRYVQEQNKAK